MSLFDAAYCLDELSAGRARAGVMAEAVRRAIERG